MSNVYRFTGPPENWLSGIGMNKWAVNDNNVGMWKRFEPGDIALMHSTTKSNYSKKTTSSIIGYAVIASKKWTKDEWWWIDEKMSTTNKWPYVFTLDEVYLFDGSLDIDFVTDTADKTEAQIAHEVEALASSGLPVTILNQKAKKINPNTPAFPVLGSASGVNEIYEQLVLEKNSDFFLHADSADTSGLNDRLNGVLDQQLMQDDLNNIKRLAESFEPSAEGYIDRDGIVRIRKDNETQKRRIAHLENHTCQVCGFYCEYVKKNGQKGWIIDVDHIIEKQEQGNEKIDNLWVLCPNCHRKKTNGIINIDKENKYVTVNEEVVVIRDNHLGWVSDNSSGGVE